jgi:acetolactate synthase-1/2/3 large subunit
MPVSPRTTEILQETEPQERSLLANAPPDAVTEEVARQEGLVRLADWVMEFLASRGVEHVFLVPGGGAMHLNDAAGLHPALTTVNTLHEQGAAIAAEAYTKASGRLALCLVTAGPGGTNAITGVTGAWLDSTPVVVVSGQVKRDDLVGTTGVRQRGVQEIDIVSMVRSITKDASLVIDPTSIRYHLERALFLATSGRPGPVWIDLPLDVQAAKIDPTTLRSFDPLELEAPRNLDDGELEVTIREIATMIREARRPLVHVGAGVRLAGAEEATRSLVERLGVPVVSTWPAQGVLGDDHPLFFGRPGALAPRGANFVLQNADLVLCLGTRLDLASTGYDPKDFGRNARKIVVDIDPAELFKLQGAIELPVCADVGRAIAGLTGELEETDSLKPLDIEEWRLQCRSFCDRYPLVTDDHRTPAEFISTYHFADELSDLLEPDDVLAPCSSGLGIEIFLLALRMRTGQRATLNSALGAMGYGPPAAIGACLGSEGRRTIGIDGDGGLQLNVQELETIRRLQLPVKLFILSNNGYASIRASQQRWFGRLVGADSTSGMTLPPLHLVAQAYGIPYVALSGWDPLGPQLRSVLDQPGPVICEVPSPPDEPRGPSQASEATPSGGMRSRPIEDLAPFLSREELGENMLPPVVLGRTDSTP